MSALVLLGRSFQVYVEQSAQSLTTFVVSAGQRGIIVRLRVSDFMSMTHAKFADAAVAPDAPP